MLFVVHNEIANYLSLCKHERHEESSSMILQDSYSSPHKKTAVN